MYLTSGDLEKSLTSALHFSIFCPITLHYNHVYIILYICALWQVETGEDLQCPVRSSKPPVDSSYASLAGDLLEFQELRQIPVELYLDRMDNRNGIESTLLTNRAQWHKTCQLKYDQTMLQQWRKLSAKVKQSDAPKVHTRSAHSHVKTKEPSSTSQL